MNSTENTVFFTKRLFLGALAIFCALAFGTLQSLDAVTLFNYLRANAHLRQILRSCLVVNGVFFLSLWIASFIFSSMWTLSGRIVWGGGGDTVVGNVSDEAAVAASAMNQGSLAGKVLSSVFDVMWVLPVYALTQALGVRWYNALYTEAYTEKRRRASPSGERWTAKEYGKGVDITSPVTPQAADEGVSLRAVVLSFSEIMFKALVTAIYAFVAAVVGAVIPSPVGNSLAFVMNSWLYAFYVFDYRLSSQYVFDRRSRRHTRVTLTATLRLFEAHWAYFLGFGATHSIITAALRSSWFASSWFSTASVTSVLFGAHIVLSVEAVPAPRAPFSVSMLTPFFALCGMLLRVIGNALH